MYSRILSEQTVRINVSIKTMDLIGVLKEVRIPDEYLYGLKNLQITTDYIGNIYINGILDKYNLSKFANFVLTMFDMNKLHLLRLEGIVDVIPDYTRYSLLQTKIETMKDLIEYLAYDRSSIIAYKLNGIKYYDVIRFNYKTIFMENLSKIDKGFLVYSKKIPDTNGTIKLNTYVGKRLREIYYPGSLIFLPFDKIINSDNAWYKDKKVLVDKLENQYELIDIVESIYSNKLESDFEYKDISIFYEKEKEIRLLEYKPSLKRVTGE